MLILTQTINYFRRICEKIPPFPRCLYLLGFQRVELVLKLHTNLTKPHTFGKVQANRTDFINNVELMWSLGESQNELHTAQTLCTSAFQAICGECGTFSLFRASANPHFNFQH